MHSTKKNGPASRGSIRALYATIWKNAEGRRGHVVTFVALLIVAQCIRLYVPWLFGKAVDVVQVHGSEALPRAGWYLVGMLAAVFFAWVLHGPARIIERFTGLVVRERFADSLHASALAMPLRWHERHHSGDTLYRMTKAASSLSTFAQQQFIYLQHTISIIGPIIALGFVSWETSLAAFVGYGLIGIFVVRIDKVMVQLVKEENAAERRYNAALVDALGNISTVLTLRLQKPMRRLLGDRLVDVFAPLRRNIVFNEVKWAGIDLLNNAMRTGLVALYVWLHWKKHGVISVGMAVMVHQYSQQVGTVVAALAMHWNELVRFKTDVADVDDITVSTESSLAVAAPAQWNELSVEDVRFVHPNAPLGTVTLDGVSLSMRRGQKIALVGESGAGKSTLLRILAGLIEADQARVRVDGVEAENANNLASLAMLLPQDPEIFESSLRENVTMGLNYSQTELERACDAASLGPVIAQLPHGLDTRIAERGVNLSGGQKQRLALARGLLAAKEAGLVLLDEATSSVDANTEAVIYERMMPMLANACVISSVHRLHLLSRFDTVVLMANGRIVECGPPSEVRVRRPEMFKHWVGPEVAALNGQTVEQVTLAPNLDPSVEQLRDAV